MEPVYTRSEGTVKPLELEVGKRTIWLRKNIIQEERTDELGNKITFWVYDEAKMAPDYFNEYSSFVAAKNAINGVNDSDNISKLIAGQKNGDNNQLVIMEAIADLYDAIASMM